MKIPIFPLNVVLFPGQLLPLNIFEERYKSMLQRCLSEQSGFGVALIKQGREARGALATPVSIGTIAQIVQVDEQQGGNFAVLCRGENRFRISALERNTAEYLQAEVDIYPDEPVAQPALLMVAQRVSSLFDEYYRGMIAMMGGWQKEISPGGRTWLFDPLVLAERHARLMESRSAEGETTARLLIPTLPDDPVSLSFIVASELNVGLDVKQDLLEAPSALARLQKEAEVLTADMPSIEERVRAARRQRLTAMEQMN
jgi:hypothetical protein